MNKIVVSLFSGFLSFAVVQTIKADILYSTDFNSYTDGNLVGQDAWAAFSGAGNKPVQVSGGAITLQQSAGSGEDDSHDVGATLGAGSTWYYAMDVTVSSSSSLVYFAGLLQGTANYEGKLFVVPSISGGDFSFGVGGSTSTAPAVWGTGLSFGTTYQVVVGFDFDTSTATLWVDPTSEASSSVSDVGAFQDAATAIAFRQATPTTANSQVIDNLIVATSFNDIIPVPEPSSLALMACSGVACLLAFRRRN